MTLPDANDAPSTVQATAGELAVFLCENFCNDPVETLWDGHLQYTVARWVLERAYSVAVGEPGGSGDRVALISNGKNGFRTRRGNNGAMTDSGDFVVVVPPSLVFRMELKSYPSVGRKRGRAGMEKGLKKDLDKVRKGTVWFVFVADAESYQSMLGEREGGRGPQIHWCVTAPSLEELPKYEPGMLLGVGERALWRVERGGLAAQRD